MDDIQRYMNRIEKIDREYEDKIDKLRKDWSEQISIYYELIERERKNMETGQ